MMGIQGEAVNINKMRISRSQSPRVNNLYIEESVLLSNTPVEMRI